MMQGNERRFDRLRGTVRRRVVAMLLTLAECLSLVSVGASSAWAQEFIAEPAAVSTRAPGGYGELVYDDGSVSLRGELPQDAAISVRDAYPDYAGVDLAGYLAQQEGAPEGISYALLGAWNLGLSLHGGIYQPKENALELSIYIPGIAQAGNVQVWYVDPNGQCGQVSAYYLTADSLSFPAPGAGDYLVVTAQDAPDAFDTAAVMEPQHLSVTDGSSFIADLHYESDAGIPDYARFVAGAIDEYDPIYSDYAAWAAELVGIGEEQIAFAKAFELLMIDPESGAVFAPQSLMQVDLTLLDTDLDVAGSLWVVRLGAESGIMDAVRNGQTLSFAINAFDVYVVLGERTMEAEPEFVPEPELEEEPAEESALESLYFETDGLTVAGDVPAGTEITAWNVYGDYSDMDMAALTGEDCFLVAAYDLSLARYGEFYESAAGETWFEITVSEPGIAAEHEYRIWRFARDGRAELIPDYLVEGESLRFALDYLSTIFVLQLSIAPQPEEDAEPVEEPELTDEPASTGEPEDTADAEPFAEVEPVEDPTTPEDAEPFAETEPADDGEPADDREPTDDGEPADDAEPTDDGEPADDGEPVEDGEPTNDAEPADDAEPVEGTEPAEDDAFAEDAETDKDQPDTAEQTEPKEAGDESFTELEYIGNAIALSGEVPVGTEVVTADVLAAYADFDPRSILPQEALFAHVDAPTFLAPEPFADTAEQAEEGCYTVLAAYDISLSLNGEDYQPGEEHPIEVSITDAKIDPSLALQLWHILDAGGAEEITDFTVEGNTIRFTATGFSVYVVVGYTVTQIITASDGNEYLVTVTYDSTTGIPENAELAVSEIKEGEAGYEEYVALSAAALGETPENLALARAFDISLVDPATGMEYQPVSGVKVSIELLKDNLNNYENVEVIHISGEADGEAQIMPSIIHGEAVEFETDGFSVYVLIGSNGETVTPQRTYTFWIPNPDTPGAYKEYSFTDAQENTIYRQTITSGEELIVPQLTSTDTEVFAGWYLGDMTGGTLTLAAEPYDFDDITITENSAIDLYAVYKNYAVVIFHDQYDSSARTFPVAYTRRAELAPTGEGESATTSATVKISDLSTTYTSTGGANMAFFGWSETPITTPGAAKDDTGNTVAAISVDAEGCITITGEKHLYPIYKEVHQLTYYAAQSGLSAAYVPPAQFFAGDPVSYDNNGTTVYSMPTTSRDGYTFLGWWTGTLTTNGDVETVNYGAQITRPDGSLVASADDGGVYIMEGKLFLRSDAVLYARWEASYSIVYWKQVTTESPDTAVKHYEYAETATRTAQIGDTVSVAETDRTNDRYDGYRFSYCDPASATIGNTKKLTVLNVYYDLSTEHEDSAVLHTLAFKDSVSGAGISADLPKEYADAIVYGTSLLTGNNGGSYIPNDPISGRKSDAGNEIYSFSGWYFDENCTIRVFFENPNAKEIEALDGQRYVVIETMPDHDLTFYAGWTAIKFRVDIDPNYGALYYYDEQRKLQGTGATYFNNTYDAEPIGEYTHVTRDYVESSSGTWYYVNHDRVYGGADRFTYYSDAPSEATEDTTFEYAPGVYTYVGWYEVYLDANGNEIGEAVEPYDFSQHTDHNTKLRLHWKKAGTYYLAYDAGDGTLEDGTTKSVVLPSGYADYADVVLTRSAIAPTGYTFIGWQVRGSDSNAIYTPGQIFTLHADDAKRVSGKEIVYLDAVYARVGTATIVYNANGGTVAETGVDFGKTPGNATDEWNNASGTVDTTAETATVSGLANNSKFKLSDGTGFTAPADSNATFLGWSDKKVCDTSAQFYSKDSGVVYGVSESTTLYAVWGTQVTYNLNSTDADWGVELWDATVYTKTGDAYSQTANLGTVVSEPEKVPVYTGADGKLFRCWATRTGEGTDADPYVYTEYDFSRPVTGALDLYAYWSEANTVTVHAVDASGATLVDTTGEDGWAVTNVIVSSTETELTATSHVTTVPENYEFAFAAVASDLNSISESNAVTAIKYENKKVKVKYIGETSFRVLGEGRELYFVYFQKKMLDIGYKSMGADGVLHDVETTGAPANTVSLLGEYSMSSQLTAPLSFPTAEFTNYAFAIGSADPGSGTQMNASNLSLITNAVGAGDSIPTLRVRNTWRGFEYTTEAGDNAVWTSCGYDPQLYVIYYAQQPTVVMFNEKTVGTSAVMETAFTFNLLVTEATTTTVSVQTQVKNASGDWENSGEPSVTTTTGEPTTVFDTTVTGNKPYILKNGEANSSILFYSSTVQTEETVAADESTKTITTTTTVTAQTAKITQTANNAFTTSIDVGGTAYTESPNEYTYTAAGSGGTVNVTFTNTHKTLPVEIHVAMVENDGTVSGIVQRDSTFRSTTEANYTFDLALGASETLLTKLPASTVFTGDADTYAFGAVVSGTGTEGSAITIERMGVMSIGYAQISDNSYGLVLKDSDDNIIGELGSNQLYYLYYPMPKIRYVKEAADGTLTDISGCLVDATTGSIVASDAVSYSHRLLTMNGKTVAQNESFEIPLSGFVISQSGNNFRMPPVLDDGLYERYLSYVRIGAGSGEATNSSDLDVSNSLTMQLKVQNNTLQYSFDGTTWTDLPLNGTPTIYAIYAERGYDFQISKTVDTSQSGENAIFSNASFTVTISSTAITKNSYDAEGAESATVTATPATETTPGTIVFTVIDGTKVRIKGLSRGEYTITESGNENYTLTARTGSIVGSSTSPMTVTDGTTVSFTLDTETKVDLTNSPKAICKIGDRYFYTLRSMVEYVDSEIATKTATAEMLTDYLMPAADTVEILNGCNITLTTADSVGRVAVITRTEELADVPLFTNNGTLTITNVTLEGNSVASTAPMIQSAGDLTIYSGATIQNVVDGGAINATAGDITVSGTIQNCSAAEGGAIYHAGNSTITLNGAGVIQNNTATSGNGGAISLAGGTINVSGTSKITGNKAESGNGGAIYAGNAVIEVDQGGSITGNTAQEGGAIYAETGTISIFETENVTTKPAVTGNTATTGNGGAIHVGAGSVTVSGGSVSGNMAEAGNGGAIYANTASVTISGTAEVNSGTAKEGGAVYAVSGTVAVSGGTVDSNTATTGNGGAVYAASGNVTVAGGSLSGNTAETGSGGAIHAGSGNVTVSGGSLAENKANTDGGAINAGSGSVTVSGGSLSKNTAAAGNGGAICANTGAVSVTGITLTGNNAGASGGAVYAGSGAVTATNSAFGGIGENDGNTAGTSGGAIYVGSGNVTVSGGSMTGNTASTGNGGALYVGSGAATVSGYTENSNTTYTQFTNNSASGNGGAVYLDSGSLTMTTVTATGNSAVNGAAVFTNTGRASFSGGSYTGNIASNGGAVGVGNKDARLYFTGDVQVKDNKLGTGDDAPKSNVYLNQDDDAVINIDTLGANADIGIYVPDDVLQTRSVPGARFAIYTNNGYVNKITNDRFVALTVQSDTAAKKLYWGNAIKVEVRYLASYSGGFPPANARATKYTNNDYYPEFNDGAISELAAELITKNSINPGSTTAVYGGAFQDGASDFVDYVTKLTWNTTESKWQLTKRDGSIIDLGDKKIIIYYAEPAYISIENNTDMTLTITDMKVNNTSVINSDTVAGYGMVFAKNGAIRSGLLPIAASDLTLTAGQSVTLLIPGGRNMAYTLDGGFNTSEAGDIRLRRTGSAEETLAYSASGAFNQLTGTTLNASGTYSIIFGDDKVICKVVDANGVEHPYSKISEAIADIVATTGTTPPYTLTTAKTATIEMVTDYLLPASDLVRIPPGYDITLTTAAKEDCRFPYTGEGSRAIISRDSENKESMITSDIGDVNSSLTLKDLIIDGKSVRGSSAGGAVNIKFFEVTVDHVDFVNVYASQGGALYIDDWNNSAQGKANSRLTVTNSTFSNCNSTQADGSRIGGGAIHFYGNTFVMTDCTFNHCDGGDQAGAVFHRVEGNYESWTTISGCTFTNCSAKAAGGLELDSKYIEVSDCVFEHCVATERNGGGFNAYMANSATPAASTNCRITLTNCQFNDCQAYTQNGGGFRSTAVYTTVKNCSFTNTSGNFGGGIAMSNTNALLGEVYGCTFERCTAIGQGGGVASNAKELIIGDYTYSDDEGEHTAHTSITNCTSANEGGGVYHARDLDGSSLTITNATITGNQTRNSSKNGGGVWTNARAVDISGATITDNTCTSAGGGVYAYSYTSLAVEDSNISRNTAPGSGGGIWFDANSDANRAKQVLTIKGSTIDDNTSGSNGGGVYTLAKTVTIGDSETRTDTSGKPISSSISGNTAKNGGGIYHSRNAEGSSLTISNASINDNTANTPDTNTDRGGGAIFAIVRTLEIASSEISRNSSTRQGGGIYFDAYNDNTARQAMKLILKGCTLDSDTAGGNGGAIYTAAYNVEITSHTKEEGGETVPSTTTISNCTAASSGGGLYHNQNGVGSELTIQDTHITGCSANDSATNNAEHGGGGVYAYVRTTTVKDSEISGNSAVRNGGGILALSSEKDRYLTIDHSYITGNTSGNQGGGIYTCSQLTLRNGTVITGNRLTTNTAANCAGVYLNNNRTLFVGSEGAASDTIIVRGNTTANGTLSDLRLWENGTANNQPNNPESVFVYCNLEGEIRVVNAKTVSAQFGSSEIASPDGFSDTEPVFKADSSTLHGIIDRNDPEGKRIIWAGPPIAKITDGEGNLLYLKGGERGTNPAIFDRLGTGNTNDNDYSSGAAFNMLLTTDVPELYTSDGKLYTGNDYIIKMLDSFVTSAHMNVTYVEGRTITLTTASRNDTDGYPYIGSGTRATITRGTDVSTGKSTLNAKGNLILENIILDAGTTSGVAVSGSSRCIWIENANCTVTLGENSILQNGHVNTNTDGGGVFVNKGAFEIKGGVIRNCTARNGGGVYLNGGSFNMSGGTISAGSAAQGGGVYVANSAATPFNMSGGSIINNYATTRGGGVAVGGANSRLYFSGKVNISGNTCDASVAAGKACNVELNQDRPTINNNGSVQGNGVINTNNGGLYAGSYVGVYVPDGASFYDKHGIERKPFGTFTDGDNTATFYSFVNDRNGLKGGIIENPSPNTIYWIKIFSLEVKKKIVAGASTAIDPDELFLFEVNIRGTATVTGQLNANQIDSSTGEYGAMQFSSNGTDTTRAVFALKNEETITGVNLSEGLTYEVIEFLTLDQARRYAAMPMNGYSPAVESLTYDGTTYQVIRANTYTSAIGENKSRTDVDPYTSSLTFTNLMPVCKITDMQGNLLYRRYDWEKVTNKEGEGQDGGSSTNQPYYYAPAVFTDLTGENGAFKALEGTLFTSNGSNPTSYSVSNGVQIQMLIGDYSLNGTVAASQSKVTLTTAASNDTLFPKQDAGTTSTIRRAFADGSMLNVTGDLTLSTIILDGVKGTYTVEADGGIASVASGGKLTSQNGAVLQNSRTAENYYGGAVYVADGGIVTMTGGTINRNESVGDGAGIYLATGGILNLSGSPSFGGTGRDVSGNISTANGNFKAGDLVAATNGGKAYSKARQDIFIEESQDAPASVVLTGILDVADGSIWVWADSQNHYETMKPFAAIESGKSVNGDTYLAFRNARPDTDSLCGNDTYLSGSAGENASFVYWSGGFDVRFKKINGFGAPLPDATFTLYTDAACSTPLYVSGAPATAKSADNSGSVKTKTGEALNEGEVLFEQLPANVYYMQESSKLDGYAENNNIYLVLVGDAALNRYADFGITKEDITAQTEQYKTAFGVNYSSYAIFLLDNDNAVIAPDIAEYGVMNTLEAQHKVILRKAHTDSEGVVTSLGGAYFRIFRADMSEVISSDYESGKGYVSGDSGVFFIGTLPEGEYYLLETEAPTDTGYSDNAGKVFILTVNADGGSVPTSEAKKITVTSEAEMLAALQAFVKERQENTTP